MILGFSPTAFCDGVDLKISKEAANCPGVYGKALGFAIVKAQFFRGVQIHLPAVITAHSDDFGGIIQSLPGVIPHCECKFLA